MVHRVIKEVETLQIYRWRPYSCNKKYCMYTLSINKSLRPLLQREHSESYASENEIKTIFNVSDEAKHISDEKIVRYFTGKLPRLLAKSWKVYHQWDKKCKGME